jgi:hypothetical protein
MGMMDWENLFRSYFNAVYETDRVVAFNALETLADNEQHEFALQLWTDLEAAREGS